MFLSRHFHLSALGLCSLLGALLSHSLCAADWPGWRGSERTGVAASETGLLPSWPESGPPLTWMVEGCGRGYSSVAVAEGRIFTLGHLADEKQECLIAFDESSGKRLWATPFGTSKESNATPMVDGDRVYGIGRDGDLVCVRVSDGERLWSKRFDRDFGGKMMSGWGYSECPLVDGDLLMCTPGGQKAMMVALDKRTGEEQWRTAMPEDLGGQGKDGAGYASIVVSHGAGVKQYVQLTGRGVIGVRASDGELLWHYNPVANGTANIPTPIIDGDHVFCSTGYGTGSALLKLSADGDGSVKAEEVYFLKSQRLQNHHGGMVLIDGHIYCGHRHNEGFPICVRLSDGEIQWGGRTRGEGKGSAAVTAAEGHLIFRYQSGDTVLIKATPEAYEIKGKFMPAHQEGRSWAHPVVANGHLYLREQDKLMRYDLRQGE